MTLPPCYAFGAFLLDPVEGQLLKDGEPVKISAKALDMLLALVKRPGRLVTKAELLAEVWPGLFVEEGNLSVHMTALRRALSGESRQTFIETVPRRGYRFVADVREVERPRPMHSPADLPHADASMSPAVESLATPTRRRRKAGWIAAALVLMSSVFAIGALARTRGYGSRAGEVQFVIVAPFTSLDASADQGYLAVGMAEALTARLGQLVSLKVAPIAAVRVKEDPFEAGQRLDVDAVLTGSVQRQGDRLRVTAQLSGPHDRRILWSGQFNERATDIFALQDRIAERIASSLVRGISPADRAALKRRETVSSDAYDLYLRAREQWTRRTPDAVRVAIRLYGEAIATDTGFALAYAGLANAYNITRSGLPASVRYPLARAAAERALALDDRLPEAQTARAFQHYKFEWRWDEAEARFRTAIALNPSYALAHHWYGECLFLRGRNAQAITEYRKALDLDPYSTAIDYDLARALLREGKVAEAHATLDAGLALNRNDGRLLTGMSEVLAAEGKEAESLAMKWRALLVDGANEADVDSLRKLYATAGITAVNEKTLERLLTRADRGQSQAATMLAQAYGRKGDRAQTLHWLRRAIALKEDGAIQLRSQRAFDFLKGDPEYQSLLVQVGLAK